MGLVKTWPTKRQQEKEEAEERELERTVVVGHKMVELGMYFVTNRKNNIAPQPGPKKNCSSSSSALSLNVYSNFLTLLKWDPGKGRERRHST